MPKSSDPQYLFWLSLNVGPLYSSNAVIDSAKLAELADITAQPQVKYNFSRYGQVLLPLFEQTETV